MPFGSFLAADTVMSVVGKAIFVPADMYNFADCAIQDGKLNVYHSVTHFLFFPFQLCINFGDCLSCSRVLFPCEILLLMWLALDAIPVFEPF